GVDCLLSPSLSGRPSRRRTQPNTPAAAADDMPPSLLLPASASASASASSSSGISMGRLSPRQPPTPLLVCFPARRSRNRLHADVGLRLAAAGPNGVNGAASPGPGDGGANNLPKNRRDILLEYVKGVQPEFMELFVKRAPTQRLSMPCAIQSQI
uniref:Uncharacterized protein n=1 Tax=Aegilops tauschii subsp. strangulata TaxID=200361 RepID=A0A453Q8G7_AEGTS